jgi:hypothetical protein
MKKILFSGLLLTLVALLATNCKKVVNIVRLQGEWELLRVTGGISGQGYTPEWNELAFSDRRYEISRDETLLSSGTYEYDPDEEHGLTFEPAAVVPATAPFETDPKKVVFRGPDTLILGDPCCDRFEYTFVRERNDD